MSAADVLALFSASLDRYTEFQDKRDTVPRAPQVTEEIVKGYLVLGW